MPPPRDSRVVLVAGHSGPPAEIQTATTASPWPDHPPAVSSDGYATAVETDTNPPFSTLVRGFDEPDSHRLMPMPPLAGAAHQVHSAGGVARMTAFLVREESWYRARAVEVDVSVIGKTVEQALAYLREALETYFETHPVPFGVYDGAIIAPVPVNIRR